MRRVPLSPGSGFSQERVANQRTCSVCGGVFFPHPQRLAARVCGPKCGVRYGKRLEAERKARQRAERAADREKKQAFLSVKQLKALAQDAFNDFIRARDADLPCVSCGDTDPPMTPGGQWDAGHFLSRGAYPELAFNEDNCHKQCKSCNAGAGKYPAKERTVRAAYEIELERRIGPERLAKLKGPHPVLPLEKDALIAIRATYKAKLKELKEKA